MEPVRKGISHPLNLLLISMQPRWRGQPESALHPSASPSEAALAKKRGAKRAKRNATKAVLLRLGRRARMMQMADARRKRKRCRIRPFTLYGQMLSGFPALTGYDEARRDIWCKFVEIFIHFSICTLCKGIASAAKATGLTEVGIVFSAVR